MSFEASSAGNTEVKPDCSIPIAEFFETIATIGSRHAPNNTSVFDEDTKQLHSGRTILLRPPTPLEREGVFGVYATLCAVTLSDNGGLTVIPLHREDLKIAPETAASWTDEFLNSTEALEAGALAFISAKLERYTLSGRQKEAKSLSDILRRVLAEKSQIL